MSAKTAMISLTVRSPSAHDTQRAASKDSVPSSGDASSAKASSGPTKAKAAENAMEKKIAVSITEPASVPKIGARHQLRRRSQLNTVTSRSWAVRKAAPEAMAMRTSRPAAVSNSIRPARLSSGGTMIEQATASMKPTKTTRRANSGP